MADSRKDLHVRCTCGCCELVVSRIDWEDETDYSVCVQDSYYDTPNSLINRIKRAFGILLGKPIPFNEVYIEGAERFGEIVDALEEMRVDER